MRCEFCCEGFAWPRPTRPAHRQSSPDLSDSSGTLLSVWKLYFFLFVCLAGVIARAQTSSPAQAQALERQGKLEEAARVWEAVTTQNPHDAAAFASLGVVLSRQEKYPAATAA